MTVPYDRGAESKSVAKSAQSHSAPQVRICLPKIYCSLKFPRCLTTPYVHILSLQM